MNATTFTLTNKEIMPLFEKLFDLDGRLSAEGKPFLPFKYKEDTRLRIARNIKALTPVYEELQEQKKKMRLTHLGSEGPIENEDKHPGMPQLRSEWSDLMASTQDLELYEIKYDGLRAEDSAIAPSVIASLLPIIKTD